MGDQSRKIGEIIHITGSSIHERSPVESTPVEIAS